MDLPATSAWDQVREWLGLAFAGATALFAGLVWWMARKSFSPQIEALFQQRTISRNVTQQEIGLLFGELRINNHGRSTLLIDYVEVRTPKDVPIWSRRQAVPTTGPHAFAYASAAGDFHQGVHRMAVPSGASVTLDLQLVLPEARMLLSSVRISLKVASSSRAMRQRTQLITAMLADNIRNV